jgi:hypothetical protein
MTSRGNCSEQRFDRDNAALPAHMCEWQRLDDPGYLVEAAIELGLDRCCEATGGARVREAAWKLK